MIQLTVLVPGDTVVIFNSISSTDEHAINTVMEINTQKGYIGFKLPLPNWFNDDSIIVKYKHHFNVKEVN